jgi:hypothetical protein
LLLLRPINGTAMNARFDFKFNALGFSPRYKRYSQQNCQGGFIAVGFSQRLIETVKKVALAKIGSLRSDLFEGKLN